MTRTRTPVITGHREIFSDDLVWRECFPRLVASLERKGAPHHLAEDAAQEALIRAYRRRVPHKDSDDLLRWAYTVAWRLVLDERRRAGRVGHEVLDLEAPELLEPEYQTESRLGMQAVASAWRQLRPSDRDAILSGMEHEGPAPASRQEANRLAVRRHRARNRLAALLEGAAVVVIALRHRARVAGVTLAVAGLAVIALPNPPPNTTDLTTRPPERRGPTPALHQPELPPEPARSADAPTEAPLTPARPSSPVEPSSSERILVDVEDKYVGDAKPGPRRSMACAFQYKVGVKACTDPRGPNPTLEVKAEPVETHVIVE